jgi:hypothetical protein
VKEVKCEHCGLWANGLLPNCSHCHKRLNDQHLNEIEALKKNELRGIPLIKIDPESPFILRGFLVVLRFIQLIFLSIISMIAAMASSTVH